MPYALRALCICCRKEHDGADRYCAACNARGCCTCSYTDCGKEHRNACRHDRDSIRIVPPTITRSGRGELVITGEPDWIDIIQPRVERMTAAPICRELLNAA